MPQKDSNAIVNAYYACALGMLTIYAAAMFLSAVVMIRREERARPKRPKPPSVSFREWRAECQKRILTPL